MTLAQDLVGELKMSQVKERQALVHEHPTTPQAVPASLAETIGNIYYRKFQPVCLTQLCSPNYQQKKGV